MAVGTGRSANQLHIYSEEGGGIKAMGKGRGWSLSQFGCSGSAASQGRATAQQVEPVGGLLPAGNSPRFFFLPGCAESWRWARGDVQMSLLWVSRPVPSRLVVLLIQEAILGHGGVRSVGRRAGCRSESSPVIGGGREVSPPPATRLPTPGMDSKGSSSLGSPVTKAFTTPSPSSMCWASRGRNAPVHRASLHR